MGKRYRKKTLNHSLTLPPPIQAILPYLTAFLFFLAVCLNAGSTIKTSAVVWGLLAAVGAVFCIWKQRERITLPFALLALFVLLGGLSTFYAVSGKFALYEFLKLMVAFSLAILLLAFTPGEGATPGRRIATILEGGAAFLGLVSVDLISTRIISTPILGLLGLFTPDFENLAVLEAGSRIFSLLDNPNVFAGSVGIGVLLSLGLVLSSEKASERMTHTVLLFFNSLSFVLAFSMGASGMIALAFLVYLLLERKERRAELFLLMLETLILSMIGAMLISATSFEVWTGFQPIPLLCMVVGATVLCLLDKLVGRPVAQKLAGYGKALFITIAAVLAAVIVYAILAVTVTGGTTLQAGETFQRAFYPEAGDYTLTAQADGPVNVTVLGQNRQEAMMHTSTTLYSGDLSSASFTVPEDTLVLYLHFTADSDVSLESVTYEGASSGSLPLNYKLLPGFIANRLQGLFANQNMIQRTVFFEDGIKLFQRSPLIGLGLGSFENAIMSVQSFFYETKYTHNHYIQTLVETGILGLILFLGLLVVSGAAVIFSLRKEDPHPLTPALGAVLVFMAAHALVEVTFSSYGFLPFAFGVFALISLCCGDALPAPWFGKTVRVGVLSGSCIFLLVFSLLVCNNMAAARITSRSNTLDSLVQAAKMDKFEWSSYMGSYVLSSPNAGGDPAVEAQAAEYAEILSEVDSNIIPYYLAQYHFSNNNTEQGFAMMKKFVAYVASKPDTWEAAFSALENCSDGSEQFRAGVLEVAQMLDDWNAANIGDITLSENAQAFIESCK